MPQSLPKLRLCEMIEAKKSLETVKPYAPGRPISEIQRLYGLSKVVKLASNENPLGASPLAKEAVRRASEDIFLYPDPDSFSLRQALATLHSLPADHFVFGTGSDGLIELICKTFLAEGDESIIPCPSFSLYALNVLANGATPVEVPTDQDYQYRPCDLLSAITDKTKVIWLCNPNNPTGGVYSESEQAEFLDKVPENILVVIDEAYYEYACHDKDFPDSLAALRAHKNIIILRTFSKIYGLAGLRVGYGMASPEIIRELEKTRPPFNVCYPAQKAAEAALSDKDFVAQSLLENRENLRFLEESFEKMGLSYIKSATNFIAVNLRRDAKAVYEKLLSMGYIVKGGHVLGMPGYLRVTVGTREECRGFVHALSQIIKEES